MIIRGIPIIYSLIEHYYVIKGILQKTIGKDLGLRAEFIKNEFVKSQLKMNSIHQHSRAKHQQRQAVC